MAQYSCKQCGAAFSSENELREHEKTHAGSQAQKPYRCSGCGATFNTEEQLKEHEKTHMKK